ncbi:hypothetical protein P43SY_001060 [Pythium insidiosum]|uniref:NAD-dependent epimerase/dehydratase domain-containing protein n=1 Tax=Pythium insidiosum TaxID=114742 RepID=A0AAD5M5M3_PYTIN|nr:hypothetical protein P43SY_001060 [Pythium insidiosum]
MSDDRPRILVLGGAGMIGRNFVKHCIDHDLCSYIRIADKTMPEIAYFGPEHKQAFADSRVKFVQADLTRDAHLERAFNLETAPYDFVFNLAGETKCGLSESVYASKCRDLSVKCAKYASQKRSELGIRRFIEVSTAFVYKSQAKQPACETAELHPWTMQAKYKLEAEEAIREEANLDAVFVRPATVHVNDVCRALWHLTSHGKSGEVFNLADKNDTNQEKINALLEEIFKIRTGFIGKLVSNLARVRMSDVVDEANDKHMKPWSDLCAEHGINNTPLSPYIDKELLQHNHLFVDGSKIESTGFSYAHPRVETAELRQVIEAMIAQGIFPPILSS